MDTPAGRPTLATAAAGPAAATPAPARGSEGPGRGFVAMIAACMAMVGLAIDTILPAFGEMRRDFGLASDSTQVAWVITAFFLGLATGQLVYGPLSDRYGRKPPLFAGLALCVVGAAGAALAPSLTWVVVFRLLWGFGAAGPRSLALAMVRDSYEGDRMARTMSFAMTIFLMVPVFAPSVGAALIAVAPWQAVFWFAVVCAGALMLWALRLPETLPPQRRQPPGPGAMRRAAWTVLRTRKTVGYAVAVTFLFGSMASYLASSEIIIDRVYGRKDQFPLIFGALAVFMGVSSLTNAKLVMRLGLQRLIRNASCCLVAVAALFAGTALATGGHPPFWAYCAILALLLPLHTLLFPNCNTAAMGPVGHVAGTAAAVIGTASTAGGALLGSLVDARIEGSVTPLAIGFLCFGAAAAASILVLARD